jgi:WD40 repeat protein
MSEGARRAVLIGTGRHGSDSGLPDVPSVATTVDDVAAALTQSCGFTRNDIDVVTDPGSQAEIGHAIARAAEAADDLLLVYYVGHGVVCKDGMLHLCTTETVNDPQAVRYTGLPYRVISAGLRASRARHRVVILDCCFAGRALDSASLGEPDGDSLADQASLQGGFVLTATRRFVPAIARQGARHTAFTGELLRLLRDGDPGGPAQITLRHAYRHLSRVLADRGLPQPRCRADDAIGDFPLAVNPAYRGPAAPESAPMTAEGRKTSPTCPYKGLAAFDVGDERWFHGRRALTSRLLDRLRERHHGVARPLAVVGASGAGKSSLLRAGLLPAVERGQLEISGSQRWPRLVLTPGPHPVRRLAEHLVPHTGLSADEVETLLWQGCTPPVDAERLLLVVDQFEESFTLCEDQAEATAFITMLDALAGAGHGGPPRALVVAGIREDFYGRLTVLPVAAGFVRDPVVVTAMSAAEVREAIEAPAREAGLDVRKDLIDLLLEDLGATAPTSRAAAYEPGRLPLLSHALRMTWQHHEGTMTVEAYRATGGIREALARSAEAHLDKVPPDERDITRRLFLRLIRAGEHTDHVRQVIDPDDLTDGLPADACTGILDLFTGEEARLLTADASGVRITHEALIGSWPRLRAWVEADHAELRARQEIAAFAAEWRRGQRPPDYLYRGHRLAAALETAAAAVEDPLPPVAEEFLAASAAADRRRLRVRAGAVTALAVLLVATSATAVVALRLRDRSVATTVDAQRRAVILQAELIQDTDSLQALKLGVSAGTHPAARPSLISTLIGSRYRGTLRPAGQPPFTAMTVSDDGKLLAAADGTSVVLWNVSHPERPVEAGRIIPDAGPSFVEFAPESRILAVGGETVNAEGSAGALYDVADPARPQRLGAIGKLLGVSGNHANGLTDLAFNHDGTRLATSRSGFGDSTTVWDTSDPRSLRRLAVTPSRHQGGTVYAIDFSADGRLLATGSKDNSVAYWRVDPRGKVSYQSSWAIAPSDVTIVRFSPIIPVLASGTYTSAGLYDVSRPEQARPLPPLTGGNTNGVQALAFSPDGHTMVMSGGSKTITVWDASALPRPIKLADLADQQTAVSALAFTADGRHFFSAGTNGSLLLWSTTDAAHPTEHVHTEDGLEDVAQIAVSRGLLLAEGAEETSIWRSAGTGHPVYQGALPKEERLLHGSPSRPLILTESGNRITLWDLTDAVHPVAASTVPAAPGQRTSLSDNGRTLTLSGGKTSAVRWDITDLRRPVPAPAGTTPPDVLQQVARSTDGALTLATDYDTGQLRLHSHRSASAPVPLPMLHSNLKISINDAAFSHDGSLLAVNDYGSIRVFDVTDPADPIERAIIDRGSSLSGPVSFSADDGTIIAAREKAGISIWDITDLRDAILRPDQRAARLTGN